MKRLPVIAGPYGGGCVPALLIWKMDVKPAYGEFEDKFSKRAGGDNLLTPARFELDLCSKKAHVKSLVVAEDHGEEKHCNSKQPRSETNEQCEFGFVTRNGEIKSRRAKAKKEDGEDDGGGLTIFGSSQHTDGVKEAAQPEKYIYGRNEPDEEFHDEGGLAWRSHGIGVQK